MNLVQMVVMMFGILLAVSGVVVHEVGGSSFVSDLQSLPLSDWLLYHPLATLAAGVALIVLGMSCGSLQLHRR